MNLSHQQLKEFFLSWGLAPSEATGHEEERVAINGYNGIEYIINQACYDRMRADGICKYGVRFGIFITRLIDATDGAFYIVSDTWDKLYEDYDIFVG